MRAVTVLSSDGNPYQPNSAADGTTFTGTWHTRPATGTVHPSKGAGAAIAYTSENC